MRSKHEIRFSKLERELCNAHTGEKRTFTLRPFEPGDEIGMIACIKDEYADSYFKRDFYDEKKLRQKAIGNHYVFFVAETEGEIAGMEIFALFTEDGDNYIEPASQIFRMRYRGFGLAEELVNYTFLLAKQMQPKALFVHAVTFHSITQKVCGAQGMIPTGFRLGSFLAEKMQNSYPKGNCPKHSEGIMILPVQKKNAGTVYVPEEVSGYVADCYNRLGMTCLVCTKREALPQSPARLEVVTDEVQRTVLIRVLQIGADLTMQVRAILSSCREQPFWTCQITLPVDGGDAITAYEQLKAEGFFFTGLKAACAQTEQIFMQWCGKLELHMEEYTLTEEFQVIREQIQHFYEGRILS